MKNISTTIFRHILPFVILLAVIRQSVQAQVKIGTSTDNINQSATLEVESGPYPGNIYRGFLPPRVALTDYTIWTLTGTPTDGMMVYNTATTTGYYPVSPGIYFWSNNQWNKVLIAVNPAIVSSVDCQPSVAAGGTYYATIPLTAANKKLITVVPASAGPYSVITKGGTGYSFSAFGGLQGTFTPDQIGKPQTLTLAASGTPQVSGTDTFTVTFGAQSCTFPVNVVPYIDCSGPMTGTYKVNVPLDASNTKQITFTPIAAGTNRFVAVYFDNNDFAFVADVTFTADQVGQPQTITLVARGTPSKTGTFSSLIQVYGPSGNDTSQGCLISVTIVP